MRTDRIAPLFERPGPFASVYVDVSRDQADGDVIVELTARDAGTALAEQGAPEAVVSAVVERLATSVHQGAPVSRQVVATEADGIVLDELAFHRTEQPTATWGPLPDLSDWLAVEDVQLAFLLALVDHEGGEIATYRTGGRAPDSSAAVGTSDVHENKVHGGGWSHLRYQRVAENVWARNAQAVANEIRRRLDGLSLVVLAGDPRSRHDVNEALDRLQVEVVQLDSEPQAGGPDEHLQQAVDEVVRGRVVADKLAQVHELQQRLGRDEAVAIGVRDVVDAFVRGQVDRLLIDPRRAREFTVEPADHPGLQFGAVPLPDKVPADQALIAASALTGAELTFTPARTLGEAPSAALLRWNQP